MARTDDRDAARSFAGLLSFHPATLLGGWSDRLREKRAQEAVERLSPHLRDDLGLPAAGGSESERGFVERVHRIAGRWS